MQLDLDTLARETGNRLRAAPDSSHYSAAHACASALHGWEWCSHHYGPVLLSRDDYTAALAAALRGERHAPADMRAGPAPPPPDDAPVPDPDPAEAARETSPPKRGKDRNK